MICHRIIQDMKLNKYGFTLIEILVSTILFVILVFGMFQFSTIITSQSKKSQAEMTMLQVHYNIKTAMTSSASRRNTMADTANSNLRKCTKQIDFSSSYCQSLAESSVNGFARGIVLKDANNNEIGRGDHNALTTVATKYDEYGAPCASGSINLSGACPIWVQTFYKTICLDSAATCGSLNEIIILYHYRIFIDPNTSSTSPYKNISPKMISTIRPNLTFTEENLNPQLPLSLPAGFFSY